MSLTINGKEWVSTKEVAEAMDVDPRTMLRWFRKGVIEFKYGTYSGKNAQRIHLQVFRHPISGFYYLPKHQFDAILEMLCPFT